MNAEFNINEILICKYGKLKKHFLKKPKLLPCGYSACESCVLVEASLNEKLFYCKFCNKYHFMNQMIPNSTLEGIFTNNLNELTKIKINEYWNEASILKGKKVI